MRHVVHAAAAASTLVRLSGAHAVDQLPPLLLHVPAVEQLLLRLCRMRQASGRAWHGEKRMGAMLLHRACKSWCSCSSQPMTSGEMAQAEQDPPVRSVDQILSLTSARREGAHFRELGKHGRQGAARRWRAARYWMASFEDKSGQTGWKEEQ